MKIRLRLAIPTLLMLAVASPLLAQEYEVNPPQVVLTGISFNVAVSLDEAAEEAAQVLTVRAGGQTVAVTRQDDGGYLSEDLVASSSGPVEVELLAAGAVVAEATTRSIPGWVSIVPPILAILVALITRNVIPALFLGLWVGAFAANGFSFSGAFTGLLDAFSIYVHQAITNPEQAQIILFSLMIGGMVGIVSKNGGMQGVVNRIVPLASTPQKGQAATGLLGLIIFFDDYANVLVVGNTMRQVTDKLRVSREKLAYIVDSTAAPVAAVAFVTTWIGFEVGLIGQAVAQIDGYDEAGYSIFINSIPYSFYPLLCMLFVFVVAFSGRDFGPMYDAEVRARTTGQVFAPEAKVDEAALGAKELTPTEGKPQRAINAMLPIGVLLSTVLIGLYLTGMGNPDRAGDSLREIVGASDAYLALMWGSLLGASVAGLLSISQRVLTLAETVDAWYAGMKSMMIAIVILVLAWSLSSVTTVLNTAGYLVSVLGEALNPGLVPALVFLLSAATAFATGSSWGTMGILMPLVVPLTWAVLLANSMANPAGYHIIYSTVACILAGAVWGDHCSPISDTTILSSMASGSDHIDHVRTQLPYAVLVGAVGLVVGTIPTGFGFPWWLSLVLGAATLILVHRFLGKPVEEVASLEQAPEATGTS